MNEGRTVRLVEHIADAEAARRRVVETVLAAIADREISGRELTEIKAALGQGDQTMRLVIVDGAHVNGCVSMLKTLAHTMEMTPKVTRKLRALELGIAEVESIAPDYPDYPDAA